MAERATQGAAGKKALDPDLEDLIEGLTAADITLADSLIENEQKRGAVPRPLEHRRYA